MTEFEMWWIAEGKNPRYWSVKYEAAERVWIEALRAAIHMALIDDQAGRSVGVSICEEIEDLEKGSE